VLGCAQEALLVRVGTTVPRAEALPSAHQLVLERCAARHTYACVMRACDTHSNAPLGLHMHAAAVLLSPSHWNVRAHQLLWLVSFGPALQAGRASAFPDTHLLLKCLGNSLAQDPTSPAGCAHCAFLPCSGWSTNLAVLRALLLVHATRAFPGPAWQFTQHCGCANVVRHVVPPFGARSCT
jgi:hypothetical protein